MSRKRKSVTAWVVFDPQGFLRPESIRFTRKASVESWMPGEIWKRCQRIGYTARKVTITEAR